MTKTEASETRRHPRNSARARCIPASVLLALLYLLTPRHAVSKPLARFEASRNSGCTAPCAVFFDAYGNGADLSTDRDYLRQFHSLKFHWDFGDDSSASWSLSGRIKNEAFGAIAAHLYERAGHYRVRLSVSNSKQEVATASREITVDDPERVYPARKTKCVSPTGNFDGCPSDSARVISSDFDASVESAAGRRTLFQRGERFTLNRPIELVSAGAGESTIGAFGAGAKPIIEWAASDLVIHVRGDDWRIMDLQFRDTNAPGGGSTYAIQNSAPIRRLTLFDLEFSGHPGCIGLNQVTGTMNTEIFGIDISCRPRNNQVRAIFDKSRMTAWLGLDLDTTRGGYPGYRCTHLRKALIQHGRFRGENALAIRATPGFGPTQYLIVSDNTFLSTVPTAPMIRHCSEGGCRNDGSSSGEDNLDAIYERNVFAHGFPAEKGTDYIQFAGGEQTIRNNLFDVTGAQYSHALIRKQFEVDRSDGRRIRDDNTHVFNNSVVGPQAAATLTICRGIGRTTKGNECRSNLVRTPVPNSVTFADGGSWGVSDNVAYAGGDSRITSISGTSGKDEPARALERLLSEAGARAVDMGFDLSQRTDVSVFEDYASRCRPQATQWDVGAWEHGSSRCGSGSVGAVRGNTAP